MQHANIWHQGRRQRMLNAGAEGVLDQWQGELGN